MTTLKQGWDKIFGNETPKKPQVEKKPYRCILCNDDMVRFAHAGAYAHHMNAIHQFHRGYDPCLPVPSARKGYTLPKIGKKKKKKESVFESRAKALESSRAKSVTRDKKKKKDYLRLIKGYEKAKKKGEVSKWAEDEGVKNPRQRVWNWRQSLLKQARKESEIQ